jgi:hypothetical protein
MVRLSVLKHDKAHQQGIPYPPPKICRMNPYSHRQTTGEERIVKPVYRGHSREPENVAFMSSCPLYTG